MKAYIYLLLILFGGQVYSQSGQLPTEVLNGLNKKVSVKDSIKWEKISSDYLVTCYSKGQKSIVVLSASGEWKETKTPMKIEDLPDAVVDAVQKKHKEVEFYDIYKVATSENRDIYELKTDTETAGFLIRAYADGTINLSKKIHTFED
jgi:hypothetical protein